VCCVACAQTYAREQGLKKIRKEVKAGLNKLKTRRDYIKELDTVFAAYIRYRDKDKPCICCGKPLGSSPTGGGYDCGHFISRRHLTTRWDENNCHAQRKHCNRYLSGNYQGFREGLIERIGLETVENLEMAKYHDVNISTDWIKAQIAVYKAKIKEVKNEPV